MEEQLFLRNINAHKGIILKIVNLYADDSEDVLEDRHGNIWFASTDSGVYYYNGKSFQHFTTREGLANNTVMSVYEDKAGIIWLGTGGGVSRYDGKYFRIQYGLLKN